MMKAIYFLCAAPIVSVHKEKQQNSFLESQNALPESKIYRALEGHPPPESGIFYFMSTQTYCTKRVTCMCVFSQIFQVSLCVCVCVCVGAILPLALGLIISALLLLMVGCRLWLVRRRLKKALPLTTEESDYLINGMYL